jgi:hypothetical protein
LVLGLAGCAAHRRPPAPRSTARPPSLEARRARGDVMPDEVRRVSAGDALRRAARGGALLVCAYPDPEQCQALGVPGAIPLTELQRRLPGLPLAHEILLFCA